MANISIPWSTGGGNIVIEYTGEGNGSLLVYSDAENPSVEERSQTLSVATTVGSPAVVLSLTVRQGAASAGGYLLLESGGRVLLDDGGRVLLESAVEEESVLPVGYRRAEYIVSTGTQYIDTGYDPVRETVIEVGYEYTSISSSTLYYVFGNYNAAKRNSTRLIKTTSRTYINMFTSTDYNNFLLDVRSAANVRYDEILTNTSFTSNGTTYEITDTTEGTSNTRNLALFANHCLSGNRKTSMRLYYCRIKEGDTLVRDFIPCLDADGVACLYDAVSGESYYNDGTGSFGYELING